MIFSLWSIFVQTISEKYEELVQVFQEILMETNLMLYDTAF